VPLPRVITTVRDNAEAVHVPAGSFNYGISPDQRDEVLVRLRQEPDPLFNTEFPSIKATVRDCYIDRFPVTNALFAEFLKATGHPAPRFWGDEKWNQPNLPVVGVSLRDAQAYAKWAEKRLPTEEEWERAARGTDERHWPWGNEFHPNRCNCKESGFNRTTDVNRYFNSPSPVGAYDLSGNVWEMTTGNWEHMGIAIRGGCYQSPPAFCRATSRWGIDAEAPGQTWLGFRCVMDLAKARIYARAKT